MALGALCCWGSWSVTLVLASAKMPFQLYYIDFTMSFLVTGFVVGFVGGSLGTGGEQYGFTESFSTEIFGGHEWDCYLWAMSGGVVWNLANVLLCKGIGMMGNAVGFPLCVGLGMVTGAIVGYVSDPTSNLAYLIPGVLVALSGIFAVGLLSFRKEREIGVPKVESDSSSEKASESDESGEESCENQDVASSPGLARKLVVCIIGGLCLGLSNVGVGKAISMPCNMSPYANQTYFSIGVFLSSVLLLPFITSFPIEGGRGTCSLTILNEYSSVAQQDHLLAWLGGFILCAGFFFFNLGNKPLGLTTAYCIGQSAPLVGIMWGTFFFKEFEGLSSKVWGLVPVVCVLFATAILLLAASS